MSLNIPTKWNFENYEQTEKLNSISKIRNFRYCLDLFPAYAQQIILTVLRSNSI